MASGLASTPRRRGLIPGLRDADARRLDVANAGLPFRDDRPQSSEGRRRRNWPALLPGAQLVEPPWPDSEWNERSSARAGRTRGRPVRPAGRH